ncbi:MAG: pseudouridine synthase [Candidatus Sedimenticola sp. (ex Thyasira tokunagai)]
MTNLPILYRDEHYIAIDKPAGMLVHRTRISDGTRFALQALRDQIGQWVYPVHRLDRPTSGVLLFALSSDAARQLVGEFEARRVEKRYLAVVRGYTDDQGHIDYALLEEEGKERQEAVTDYRRLATVELPYAVSRYTTARFSLLEITPLTGRMHQIRKHMKHIFHPIVGDTTHGDGKQNQLFRDHLDSHRLLLMAQSISFRHPYTGEKLTIEVGMDDEWLRLFTRLELLAEG